MHVRTLLILVLLVGGLAAAVYFQTERETAQFDVEPRPLFEGVQADRIDRIRVDNLQRSVQLLAERREGGGWMIVDPLDARAEGALINVLLEALATQDAHPVVDPDLEKLTLSPPRAVLEFEEQIGTKRIKRRLEMGANDLDGQFVVVRADGVVVRTLRTFESVLDRPVNEWRSRAIVQGLSPFSLVEASRRGQIAFAEGDEPVELGLQAINDGGWYSSAPFRAKLDAGGLGLMLQTAATLRASGFVDDAPLNLAVYGLDEPQVEIDLVASGDQRVELKFSQIGVEEWAVVASGDPRIYAVNLDTMLALCVPIDAMVERSFVRLVQERVQRVQLRSQGRELELVQRPNGWILAQEGATQPADPERVGDLLDELGRARVLALLPEEDFVPDPGGETSILVEHDGRVLGGELGAPYTLSGGGEGVLFRREGDSLVTLIDAGLLELAATPASRFENRQLVLARELDLSRIELLRGETQLVFVRNELGRWSKRGTEIESRPFAILVDRLLSIRKSEAPEAPEVAEAAAAVEDPIVVQLVSKSGAMVDYALAPHTDELDRFADGGGARTAWVRAGLYDALAQLLE